MVFRRVLIAVDGTEASSRALEVGADFAENFDAEMVVLTVVNIPRFVATAGGVDGTSVENYVERIARETVQSCIESLTRRHVGAEIKVVVGPAAEVIVTEIIETSADLVVMGRRARVDPKDLVLGSVSDRVARNIEVPILLVP